jgi:hypothetical protein
MTPELKAKELVEKFDDCLTYLESKSKAKQCALIAISEVIKQCWDYRDIDLQASYDYWNEVKNEINKL